MHRTQTYLVCVCVLDWLPDFKETCLQVHVTLNMLRLVSNHDVYDQINIMRSLCVFCGRGIENGIWQKQY